MARRSARELVVRRRHPLLGYVTVGAIGLLLGPIMLPGLARLARPAAKGAAKAGLLIYRRGREVAAELGEVAEDILAEADAELAAEASAASNPPSEASNGTQAQPIQLVQPG